MKRAICSLTSNSSYSQSHYINTERKPKESHADFEARCWQDRLNINSDGYVIIPQMAFANSLKEAAKYLSIPVPGEGKARYTKHFEAGVMVREPIVLPLKKEDVPGEWVFVPSDGVRGSGKRVNKCFPVIDSWEATVTYDIFDDKITEDVFRQVLAASGTLIGIGRFRPRNMGFYGTFSCGDLDWDEDAIV